MWVSVSVCGVCMRVCVAGRRRPRDPARSLHALRPCKCTTYTYLIIFIYRLLGFTWQQNKGKFVMKTKSHSKCTLVYVQVHLHVRLLCSLWNEYVIRSYSSIHFNALERALLSVHTFTNTHLRVLFPNFKGM